MEGPFLKIDTTDKVSDMPIDITSKSSFFVFCCKVLPMILQFYTNIIHKMNYSRL